MYQTMSERQLDDFASTKRKGKPDYVKGSYAAAKKRKRSAAAKKAAATRAKEARGKAPAKKRT
jgi:hypothetical protein